MTTHPLDRFFSGSVSEKLTMARGLLREHGRDLQTDTTLHTRLGQLSILEQALDRQMGAMDMGKRCSACAALPEGGCCSAYMANNTDAILLLVNMLMGIEVDVQNSSSTECCFLGERGCILPIKPIFCLNYNCTHIRDAATPEEMARLDRCAADVLSLQTDIEGMLLGRFTQARQD